ncbi:fasciclin domain-containing protein [Saprospiraceae bacterium]|nr:fasciclin domain-containing protein [Bacteroidota bacterium]MDB4728182.1 fasciclin domain-containing protein [Saprospiraceae bacterium]
MNRLSSLFGWMFIALAITSFVACSDDDDDVTPTPQSIVEIAVGDAQFSTLVAALQRVDLVSTLEGTGPFTVFAPTNAAFTALGVDLATISDEALTEILLYHVVGADIASTDIADGKTYVSSAAGTGPNGTQLSLLVEKANGAVTINGSATVTTADVDATNGVIHIVDAVITPMSVVGHAVANDDFSSLVTTLSAASGDLVTVLSGDGPFTVFAPVNSAFDAIAAVAATLTPDQLAKVLTYHVVGGNVLSTDLTNPMTVTTVNGETFTIKLDGSPTITDAGGNVSNIIFTDVQGTNGVIHVIDAVILPENL